MNTCPSCRRPVPLTAEEILALRAANTFPAGIPAGDVAVPVLKALVRMGYMIRAANDDGSRHPRAVITERGRAWLAGKLI